MKVRVKFFGILKADTGEETLEINIGDTGDTVSVVLKEIGARFLQLKPRMDTLAYAVNHEFVDVDYVLSDGDELALLPPVSGGSGKVIRITEAPLKLDDLIAETEDHSSGALIVFTGVVRNNNDGQAVYGLTYEADVPLAEKVLAEIESEALSEFSVHHCRIQHRIGSLKLGETSVIIVVRSPHRAEAYEASRYAIEELKRRAPIWKQEHYVGGETRYLEGAPLQKGSTS
ncbi:MAG: molybdenum cofactor biosynthesis protein MoaE [Anaerolineales bacterium]|nr:molybdenum cofactor biosynthesis protein MoaE [Anaerolineales bacterium]